LGVNKQDVLFMNISNKQGLSHNTVFDIVQDSSGYIWFATQEGLNRYDGNALEVYLPDSEDERSLFSNQIKILFVDNKGTLYVGGNMGVSIFNASENCFVNYPIFSKYSDRNVSDIEQDENNNIWVSTRNGNVYRLNTEKEKFEWIKVSKLFSNITTICSNSSGLLFGSTDGLFFYNEKTDHFREIELNINELKINSIIKEGSDAYWIGTEGDGLIKLDANLKVLSHLKHSISNPNSLSNDNVRSLEWDEKGNLWIGTFVGLSIYNQQTKVFNNHYEEFGKPYALSQNSVRSLYHDKQGGMWLGTFFGGVNYYHHANIKFDLINQNGGDFSLNDNIMSDIREDAKGNFWIATNDKGLNYWDTKNNKFEYFVHDERNENSLSSNNIKAIEFADSKHLLIGTHKSGLNYLSPDTGENRVFKNSEDPKSIADNSVYDVLKDSKDNIWIGTWRGLDRFDPKTKEFHHYHTDKKGNELSSNEISFLYEDSRHRIWIGTFEGLNIFYPEKNVFEVFTSSENDTRTLSNNEITCILEDSKGRIWIGTRHGLNLFDELNRSFVSYTTKNGLSNNVIYGIIEDDNGTFWISSNGGLSHFDHQAMKVTNYDTNDGIQAMQFCNYSYCKASDGRFLFGGINGISIFRPDQIENPPFNSEVIISGLSVFGTKIRPNDKSGILNKDINKEKELILNYNQNVFSFGYTAINFISSTKINFKYILEGFDKEWQLGNDTRKVEYTNILPGNYTFKIKAIGSDGFEHDNVKSMSVIVLPPWWLTYWAIMVYVVIVVLITFIVFRLIKERMYTHNQLRIERLERDKITEINKLKLQFFTNISHEFRTPLTLIISPLQKILERNINNDWLNKQHEIMYKSTNRLLRLVDQLLEFRKSELGQLHLKVCQDDIVSFINDIYLSFAGVASQNNIVYTFDSADEKLIMHFDKNYLEKIVFNLLSNAFKYTANGENIGLKIYSENEYMVLKISDSGKGIPKDKLNLIFERYYRIDENSTKPGSGIGLAFTKRLTDLHYGKIEVESEEGKGSVFIVRLPLDKATYSDKEIINEVSEEAIVKDKSDFVLDLNFDYKEDIVKEEKPFSVLIVEDNKDISNYLTDNLSHAYNISTASNGKVALTFLQDKLPDLIISDIMMPVMDGAKFCKTIKQNIKTCHIPIILLTAKSSIEDEIEGLDIGADDYMVKPFAMNLLEARINNIMRTRRRLREHYSNNTEVEPNKIAFNSMDEDLLNRAIKIVEGNLSETDLSVDFFAKEMGMSRSNLHLKLKAITGESASDFIKKIQFRKAKNLLSEGRHSVAEISYKVGFNSPSYFSTSFKKYFGYLPSDYLEKCNGKRN